MLRAVRRLGSLHDNQTAGDSLSERSSQLTNTHNHTALAGKSTIPYLSLLPLLSELGSAKGISVSRRTVWHRKTPHIHTKKSVPILILCLWDGEINQWDGIYHYVIGANMRAVEVQAIAYGFVFSSSGLRCDNCGIAQRRAWSWNFVDFPFVLDIGNLAWSVWQTRPTRYESQMETNCWDFTSKTNTLPFQIGGKYRAEEGSSWWSECTAAVPIDSLRKVSCFV